MQRGETGGETRKRYIRERQKNKDTEGKEKWRERGYRQRGETEEYGQRERDTGEETEMRDRGERLSREIQWRRSGEKE
jgi:hypothetical protein